MNDESYIQIAIEIAKKGIGGVSPNPLVGCLIEKNGKIIGAGYHERFGGNHAEVNAIESAVENLEGSTMYINLEPCSHYGKTPPCVDRIIENKIKRVVIGTLDMNPLVSGRGIKKLKEAGIDVKVGLLEKECIELNKFFFKYITKKIPYITLKIAQTLDGKIADHNKDSKWITSITARRKVHTLRSQYDAVLIGTGTLKKDNPSLTVRLIEGRNPKRILLDSKFRITTKHRMLKSDGYKNTIIVTSKKNKTKSRKVNTFLSLGVDVVFVRETENGYLDLKQTMKEMAKRNIASILVEGGNKIFTSFIKNNLYDEILLFVSPKLLGGGLPSVGDLGINSINKVLKLQANCVEKIGEDILIELSK